MGKIFFFSKDEFLFLLVSVISFLIIIKICLIYYKYQDKLERIHDIANNIKKRHNIVQKKTMLGLDFKTIINLKNIFRSFLKDYLKPFTEGKLDDYKKIFERAGWSPLNAAVLYLIVKFTLLISMGIISFILVKILPSLFFLNIWIKLAIVIVCMFLGGEFFSLYLKIKITLRQKLILKDFSNGLELLMICTNAGLSIDRAFEIVSEELAKTNIELCKEFIITSTELRLLPDRSSAFRNLANRIDVPLIKVLVTSLVQSEEQGTSINSTLKNLIIEARKQKINYVELRAAKLPTLLTIPIMLCTFPTLFIMVLGPTIIQLMDTQ